MDDAKASFLFGDVPVGFDPDDGDERGARLAEAEGKELSPGRAALRQVIATQVATDDPPETWATAQRLSGLGLDRTAVLDQLAIAVGHAARAAVQGDRPFDRAAYISALESLPLPSADELGAALVAVVREHQGVSADGADRMVLERLGRGREDELVRSLLDWVCEGLVEDDGPLAWLSGDRTVHVEDLTAGVVLTHRLSDSERQLGVLAADFDLAGFARRDDLRLASGEGDEIVVYWEEPHQLVWGGPDGWLDAFAAGDLLAVQVGADGLVSLSMVETEPIGDAGLVARLREVYDREVDEPDLPVGAEEIVLGLLLDARDTFVTARPPLAELCEDAGLERRGYQVAHNDEIWANVVRLQQIRWAFDRFDETPARLAAVAALDAADDPEVDGEMLREVIVGLRDPEVVSAVTDELLGVDDDPELLARTRRFSERLLAVAGAPAEVAVARWLAAVVAERDGDVLAAEAQLALSLGADPAWGPAIDRSAWYASDKGDAVTAARLWRRLGIDREINVDLALVERFTRRSGPKLGRNDRCWCGSGRKFKACHLGHPEPLPLPDRVGWLYRKAIGYILRHGGSSGIDVMSLAMARAVDPDDPDSVDEALDDPIVMDVALTEGGWFERFLADRGPLLPDDEALLAAAWTLVPRTVYEVVESRAGQAMTLHDLGTGDRVEVRERTFSRRAKVGQVICGRAVPDGDTCQLIGAVVPVVAGTETQVLELCDERRGHELCEYAGRPWRPPALHTREGEPMVACTTVVDVANQPAGAILDRLYESQRDGWVELHAIGEEEKILRAQFHLEGDRLTITTHSEARMDRVLDNIGGAFGEMRVVSAERVPLRPGELPPPPAGAILMELPDDELVRHVQEVQERRWLTEHIPALGGLTPVEAAADPSRVEQLERLLASFPDPSELPAGAITMRPDRLRQLLALPR